MFSLWVDFLHLHDAIILDFINDKERTTFKPFVSMLRNFSAAMTLFILAPKVSDLFYLRSCWQYSLVTFFSCVLLYLCLCFVGKASLTKTLQLDSVGLLAVLTLEKSVPIYTAIIKKA